MRLRWDIEVRFTFQRTLVKPWQQGQTPTKQSLYDISMADTKKGWACGQHGLILRTEDGGRSWKVQPNIKVEQGTHLFAIHAIDANTAWAVGEWGTRLFTDNGGVTWQDLALLVDEQHPMFVWLPPQRSRENSPGGKGLRGCGF